MSTATLATIVLLGVFAVLMLLRVPVTLSLLLATCGCALVNGTNLTVMIRQMMDGINNVALLSIPFFILMGEVMSEGQISEKIVDLANLAVGRFRGGLAYVNGLDSMFFGGISGSAVADVSSLGSVVVPMMTKQGYTPEFSVGLTVVTACQGVLIPPSHNMVIYALAAGTGVSIGDMFLGGVIPGILLGTTLMFLCFLMRFKHNFPKGTRFGGDQPNRWALRFVRENGKLKLQAGVCVRVILNAILPMFTLVIIMGGVALGVCTVTESSAIACVYTFLLTYVIFRSAKLRNIGGVLKRSLKTLSIVLTLLATAKAFAYMMTELRIPTMLTNALMNITTNRTLLLLIINALLLVLGCFMDMAPLILIMTPILLPVATSPLIGMNQIHFGVMLIFNLAIGLCTPPVGSALFVGCAVGKTSLEKTSKAMLPMFLVMVCCLMLVTFIPALTLWVPGLL